MVDLAVRNVAVSTVLRTGGEPLLGTYTRNGRLHRNRRTLAVLFTLFCLLYGGFFALTGTIFLLQLLIPDMVLLALVIWALPENDAYAPRRLLAGFLYAFLLALVLWPDYLALTLPGMPWITAVRLVGFPMVFVLLLCLSLSGEVRRSIVDALANLKTISYPMLAFIALAVVSVAASTDPGMSVSKLIVAAVNWFAIFFISVYVFQTPGRLTKLAYFLWIATLIVSVIGLMEWRTSRIPWADHIPSFLAIQDENVAKILSGSARMASGIYRVQSKFSTPLGFAEFYALVTPFVVYLGVVSRLRLLRLLAFATLPLIFFMILRTDSRLGVVGFFMTMVLYLFVWAYWRWRDDRNSLFGPAIVVSYPAIFVAFIMSTFFVGRIRALVWGNGAQTASTESRKLQVAIGMPKVYSHPWGHGIGRSAETLGFTNGAGVLTIDSYFLGVALEFGVIGFLVYYAMFAMGMLEGLKRLAIARPGEERMLAPILVAIANFIIIKSIFSQVDNHALIFAFLGALVALCFRIDRRTGGTAAA